MSALPEGWRLPKGWTMRAAGEVATLQRGFDLPVQDRHEGSVPIFAANGSVGTHSTYKVSGPGVVTGRSGSLGNVHFVEDNFWPLNTALWVKDFHGNDPKWVSRLLRWMRLEQYTRGVGVPTLNRNLVHEVEIPLPPLAEQKRIAAILDQADELRRKRQRAIDRLNQLGQAIFHEFFGDPVANTKGYPIKKLGGIGELDRGVSKHRPRNDPALLGGIHPLIQTGDVANADGYIRTYSSTYSDLGLKQSRKWPSGTLCITIAANIGKTAILEIDACFPDSVVGFTPGRDTNAEYVQYWMERIQRRLEDIAPQSAQKNINLAILRELPIPMPERILQDEFRDAIHAIEMQKSVVLTSRSRCEQLFQSIQHAAFTGEL